LGHPAGAQLLTAFTHHGLTKRQRAELAFAGG
jgi:hypothetical protein